MPNSNNALLKDYTLDGDQFKEEVKLYRRSHREHWDAESFNWRQGSLLSSTQKAAGARVLSQILHGEQASLLVVGQLLSLVEDMTARYFLATQAADEARHVEVFQRYIKILGEIQPPNRSMSLLAERLLALSRPEEKLVGMHILVEGLAQETFRSIADGINDPLLKEILGKVSLDESRHIAFGTTYLKKLVEDMDEEQREQLYQIQSDLGLLVAGLIVDEAEAIAAFGLNVEQLTGRVLRSHFHRLQEIGLTD